MALTKPGLQPCRDEIPGYSDQRDKIINKLRDAALNENHDFQAISKDEVKSLLGCDDKAASSILHDMKESRVRSDIVPLLLHHKDMHVYQVDNTSNEPRLLVRKELVGKQKGRRLTFVALSSRSRRKIKASGKDLYTLGTIPDLKNVLQIPDDIASLPVAVLKMMLDKPCVKVSAADVQVRVQERFPYLDNINEQVIEEYLGELVCHGVLQVDMVEGIRRYVHRLVLQIDGSKNPFTIRFFDHVMNIEIWMAPDTIAFGLPLNQYRVQAEYLDSRIGRVVSIDSDHPVNDGRREVGMYLEKTGLSDIGTTLFVDYEPGVKTCEYKVRLFVQDAAGTDVAGIVLRRIPVLGTTRSAVEIVCDPKASINLYFGLDKLLVGEVEHITMTRRDNDHNMILVP